MIETIKRAFNEGLKHRYDNILKQYYPAHNSTGFTEANLTFNFAEALRVDLDGTAFSWLEAPLTDKSNHIDGVVFSKEHNAVFFIESKRIGNGNVSRKKREIVEDMVRLLSPIERDHVLKEWKIDSDIKLTLKQYIICIADFWQEKESTSKDVSDWWFGTKEKCLETDIKAELEAPVATDVNPNIVNEFRYENQNICFTYDIKEKICFFDNKYLIKIAAFQVK